MSASITIGTGLLFADIKCPSKNGLINSQKCRQIKPIIVLLMYCVITYNFQKNVAITKKNWNIKYLT